ncbi:MAG: InlB B-repeat-containing protein [Alphaproteobacteria bacterium]|nr:InlB B-repeat-containing protein [Alphaproteobacteria bacterium]
MRLLSRIFGGFVLFAILVFGGASPSFADNCYYSDASGNFCFETVEEWLDYLFNEINCDPSAGYINSNGEVLCCPTELEYIYANTETGFCECKTEYGMVFDPEIPGCVCPTGTEWFGDISEPGCCANIVEDKCCYYYSFDKKNEQDLCYSFNDWIGLVKEVGGAGYIDENGGIHGCPEGTNPNTQTGFCESTCAEGEYIPAGDYICTSCPAGYDCPGGTFNVIDYENDQGVGDPIIYTITLKNYNNTGTHQTIYEKYATGWYSNPATTTSISTATVPSRTGYTFRGFYTSTQTDATSSGNTGTQRITKTGGLPNNTTFAANTTLYAAWARDCVDSSNCTLTVANNGAVTYTTSCPNGYVSGEGTYNPVCQSSGTANCYRIDLDNTTNGGTGGAPTSVYMYRDATTYADSSNQSKWCKLYTDDACTTEVAYSGNHYTLPSTNPTKSHATFYGYVGSNNYSQSFYRSHINYDASSPQAWNSCIDSNYAYYGINSIGFDASQTPSLTLKAIYDCDEGWRGNCTLSGDVYNGYYCYSNTACTVSPTSTISFNANGGSGGRSGTVTATYGSIAPVITNSNWTTPHRFGYRFQGYADADNTNLYYGSTGGSSRVWDKTTDTTLYAQWYLFEDGKIYFYDSVDTSPSSYGSIGCSRTSCTLPTYSTAGFTKPTGATWLGWAFLCGNYEYCGAGDATDTGLYGTGSSNGAATVTNNNNFFGRWNEDELDSSFASGLRACWQFNITYNLNSGANPSGAPTTYNNCLNTTLPTPTLENYIFAGWYDNSSFSGSPVTTIAAGSTGTKTYYAKWTESSCWHTVLDNTTYGGTGGTTDIYINRSTCNVYSTSDCSGTAITTLPSLPSKTNAFYSGHYNPAEPGWGALITTSDSDRFTNLKTECNGNSFYNTLVAKYNCNDGYHAASSATNAACVANSYSVHFNSNCPTTASGTMSNQSFTYEIAQNLTNNGFTCNNRAFQGWATSASGAKVYNNQQSVSNLTTTNGGTFELYAVWTATACNAGEYLNNGTCNACPTGYTSDGATATSQEDCFINCSAGYRVSTPGGTCDNTGGDPWVTTAGQTVYYGNISPVTYCMYGYNTIGSTYHSSINSCNMSVNAGYYVPNNLPAVTSISISSTDGLKLAEIGAYMDYDGTDAVNLSLSSGNGTDLGRATDGYYNSVAIIPAGNRVVWRAPAKKDLRSIRIALASPARNITITAHSEVNGDVVVFQGDMIHSVQDQVQGWAVAPTGELIVLSSIPMECPAGRYSTTSYTYLPTGSSCSNVTAGYYTSGGGTSATPTAAGNGCLSGQTCGKCPTGWPHSAAGSNEITDCYSDTKSRAWSGTQTACTNPDTTGCSAVTCASCSNSACNYVAYVNAAGNADGEIKSGCETNNASCQQTVASLTPNTGYHTTSGNLEYCPANTYTVTFNANGGTGSPSTSEITCVYDDTCPAFATQGTLSKTNATFGGWNTASDGTGTSYAEGATPTNLTSTNGATVPLYAVWITSGCPGGQYLNNGSCISCPAGYSCAGEEAQPVMCATNTYSTGGAASCTACTGGLTTSSVADSRYHDEVADCGRILHVGAYEIRLKSIPANANISTTVPSPSLRFNYAGNANGRPDFYANMSPIASPMRVTSTGLISTTGSGDKFKTQYNNTNYYVCDDVTCVTE